MGKCIRIRTCLIAAVLIGTGLASAEPVLDPMKALASKSVGSDPLDPMAALRAPMDGAVIAEENPELGGLPNGLGAEDTYYQCVACHSVEIIKQQRISDYRWDELWTWMIKQQGMVEPDEDTKHVILTYLKENFSAER